MVEKVKLSAIRPNPDNPRTIVKEDLERLIYSLRHFPDMMDARPIIVDENYMILGGNMRYQAVRALSWPVVPVIRMHNWDHERKSEFIIKDNISSGQWDWDILANEWDPVALESYGLDVWQAEAAEVKPTFKIVIEFDSADQLHEIETKIRQSCEGIKMKISDG